MRPHGAESKFGQLTDVERDIATMIIRGHTYRESATQLGMTIDQLEASVRSAFEKLGVKTRRELSGRFGDGEDDSGGVREPRSTSPSSDSGAADAPPE